MYRKMVMGFCVFLLTDCGFVTLHLLSGCPIGPASLFLAVGEAVFLALTAGAFFWGLARIIRRNKKLVSRLEKLASSSARLLDGVFSYFDGSFIVIHSLLAQKDGAKDGIKDAEEYLAALYKEKSVDKYLEMKGKPLAFKLQAGDAASLAYVDELVSHAENFLAMLDSVKKFLPDDAYARLEMYKKNIVYNALMNKIIVSYDFYAKLIHEFFGSIIINLSKSSQPLSQEILTIKENANRFVENVRLWEKELTDDQSPRNFNALISQYHRQNSEFETVSRRITAGYEGLKEKFDIILRAVAEMSKQSSQIQTIAEKIKVLSINASIEAARASAGGKGFKVIANEIKSLSGMTHGIIEGIIRSMNFAQEEVAHTVKGFGAESRMLGERINAQRNEFSVFFSVLSDYTETFKGIFSSVSQLIGDIDVHIKGLNPLFQLHEISIQEMENLNKIISDFLGSQRSEMDTAIEGVKTDERRQYLVSVIREYERKIISQFETVILGRIIEHYGLANEFNPQGEKSAIEIF